MEIWSPDCDIFDDAEYIGLGRLGDRSLSIGITDSANDYSAGGCIDIGPESPLKSILPFTVRNLQELIDRYDELEQIFDNWPRYPDVRQLEMSATRTMTYYQSKVPGN